MQNVIELSCVNTQYRSVHALTKDAHSVASPTLSRGTFFDFNSVYIPVVLW